MIGGVVTDRIQKCSAFSFSIEFDKKIESTFGNELQHFLKQPSKIMLN